MDQKVLNIDKSTIIVVLDKRVRTESKKMSCFCNDSLEVFD